MSFTTPSFAFTCADSRDTIVHAHAAGAIPDTKADTVIVNDKSTAAPYDFASVMAKVKKSATVVWPPGQGLFQLDVGGLARLMMPVEMIDIARLRALLEKIPFRWMSASSVSGVWGPAGQPTSYYAPGFGEGHFDHGWVCAFKGEGHDQLVSRRWLDYGPWRVVKGAGDLSIVQFHELASDSEHTLEQAKPGHLRMGISDTGGFIEPKPFPWRHPELRNLYDPTTKKLTVVVHGREVSEAEMLEACAIRRYQPLEVPVENVAYIFMEEKEAQVHLHELWLRGLECRVITDRGEERIDDHYQPPSPKPPEWVVRERDRDGL